MDPLPVVLRLWQHTRLHGDGLAPTCEGMTPSQAAQKLDKAVQDRAGKIDVDSGPAGLRPRPGMTSQNLRGLYEPVERLQRRVLGALPSHANIFYVLRPTAHQNGAASRKRMSRSPAFSINALIWAWVMRRSRRVPKRSSASVRMA